MRSEQAHSDSLIEKTRSLQAPSDVSLCLWNATPLIESGSEVSGLLDCLHKSDAFHSRNLGKGCKSAVEVLCGGRSDVNDDMISYRSGYQLLRVRKARGLNPILHFIRDPAVHSYQYQGIDHSKKRLRGHVTGDWKWHKTRIVGREHKGIPFQGTVVLRSGRAHCLQVARTFSDAC